MRSKEGLNRIGSEGAYLQLMLLELVCLVDDFHRLQNKLLKMSNEKSSFLSNSANRPEILC